MFRGQDVSGCDKIYGEKAVELSDDDDRDNDDDDDDDDDDEELDDAFPESDQIQNEIEELWFKTQELHIKRFEELQKLDKRKAELQWELKQTDHRSHRLQQLRDAFSKLREKS